MSSESPSRPWVRDLSRGDRITDGVFLVEASNFKQTRNQKYFIQMGFRDRTGSIRAIRWEADEALYHSFRVDDFVRVSGRVEEFQQNPQLIVDSILRVSPNEIDYDDFLPTTPRPLAELDAELRTLVSSLENPHLRGLLEQFTGDDETMFALTRCPAGKSLHHAFIGGLAEHILSLAALAEGLAKRYERLDRDLLLVGCFVHDIGKLEELSFTRNFSYTDPGQLIGHIGLGLLMVERAAAKVDGFPAPLLLEVQHIIASHHGLLEYGALKQPMTAEAIAFHYLDNLDAKMATLDSIEDELLPPHPDEPPSDGRWSDYKAHLGRKLYFPERGK